MVADRALYSPDDVDAAAARRAQHSLLRFRGALGTRDVRRFWSLEIGAGAPQAAPRSADPDLSRVVPNAVD